MASASVGESQLKRIIRDLHEAVAELNKEHKECGEPITDDSPNLHKFSYKLEYLLQFDQKEKSTFLGHRKDYWDFFCDCLAKIKGANEGIRFVKSIPELKTSLGKGRALVRYSLVHKRFADTLQQCLINQRVTSDWYYARSPFLKSHLAADIINHLYELNEIHFDVAARGHDLDADWPTFARRTLGANSSAHLWRPPSRCSSINSLVSSYSQQAHEFLPIPDFSHGLLGDLGELGEPSPCSVADDLRIQLDQSELRQQELLESVRQLGEEAAGLRGVVKDLQGQLLASETAHTREELIAEPPSCSEGDRDPKTTSEESVGHLDAYGGEPQENLQVRLRAAEDRNMELLSRLDGALSQRDQQTSSYRHSAGKIQDLLDRLKAVEEERLGAGREAEERGRRAAALARELSHREAALHQAEEKLADLKAAGQEERDATLRRAEEKLAELKAVGQEEHDATLRRAEEKLAELKAAGQEERDATLRRTEELQGVVGRIQGALSLKEKESGNLRAQLQALQASLEARERQAEELRRRLQEEREEVFLQRSSAGHKEEAVEKELQALRERLEVTDRELSERSHRVQQQEQKLAKENHGICSSASWTGASTQDQAKKLEDYKSQCASMMALNAKLLQTVKRSEESTRELMDAKLDLQKQLATLRASEKPLPSRLEVVQLGLEDGETRLEKSQAPGGPEALLRRLEQDNRDLTEAKQAMQEQLIEAQARAEELQISLQASSGQQSARLQDAETQLRERIQMCQLLQAQVEELGGCGEEKGSEESSYSEKLPRDKKEAQEGLASRLMLAEAQRDLSRREEARLQAEVVELRAELLAGEEERGRSWALQEVTEASREDLSVREEQLKAQVEQLNRGQVEELLGFREREEALVQERDEEAQVRAALAEELSVAQEELQALRGRYNALALEHGETREALGRANTETAQLGVTVCQLSAQNQEAGRRLAAMADTPQGDGEPREILTSLTENHQENHRLDEREARGRGEVLKETEEELQALRFQLSSQTMEQQNQLKVVNGQLQEVKSQLEGEQEKVVVMETRLKELERGNHTYTQEMAEKNRQLSQLKEDLTRSQQSVVEAQMSGQQLSQRLHLATLDKQNSDLRMSAELDDLYRTKVNLEERLIELIREKDALWQKSDALEFEQKLREEETERDGSHCLSCQSPFSWWLRKHNCRLCGRAFCYYCCSSTVTVSLQQGGARERCCRDCYEQHSAVVERHPQDDMSATEDTPFGPLPQPGRPGAEQAKPDDGVFDIITEEEVNGVYDSDSLSFSTACSPGHSQQGAAELNSSVSAGDTTSEDAEDVNASVQDAEICLLRAGELTLSVPFSLDDITTFGDSSRELFIKSSCYSIIPIAVGNAGPTIGWVFTSDPKSISFSVVYRDDTHTPLEQARVLIPLTRCNSHKETIQGELKVRNPGEYTLIFDNSFSRFISKKVSYRLSVEKPVIYDGSDNAETL